MLQYETMTLPIGSCDYTSFNSYNTEDCVFYKLFYKVGGDTGTLGCSKIGGAPPPGTEIPKLSDSEIWGAKHIADKPATVRKDE